MSVRIDIDARALHRGLQRARRACRDMRPAYRRIGRLMVRSTRRTFAVGGRPERWEPLKQRRHHQQRRGKPMKDSGALQDSIGYLAERDFIEWGSELPYAAAHQYGTEDLPARPFLAILIEDEDAMAEIVEHHILGGL